MIDVAVLALPGVQLLDVAGPLDVFAEADAQAGRDAYRLAVVGTSAAPVVASSGAQLSPHRTTVDGVPPRFDTVLVAGAPHTRKAAPDPTLCAWPRDAAAAARRYGSVCSGAFLLGEAGLLAGRRIATHRAVADALAARHPEATVEPDAISVFDGPLRTAAGVTAGLDLALALVEDSLQGRSAGRGACC